MRGRDRDAAAAADDLLAPDSLESWCAAAALRHWMATRTPLAFRWISVLLELLQRANMHGVWSVD